MASSLGFTKLVGKTAQLRQHLLVSYGLDLFLKFTSPQMFGEVHFNFEFLFFFRASIFLWGCFIYMSTFAIVNVGWVISTLDFF